MNKKAIALLGAIFILIVGTLGFLIFQKKKSSAPAPVPVVTDNSSSTGGSSDNGQSTTGTGDNTDASGSGDSNSSGSSGNNSGGSGSGSTTPTAGKLTDSSIISPILTYLGDGVSYFNSQGQLFKADIQTSGDIVLLGNTKEITIAIKSGINKILWPATGNNFIVQVGSGSQRSWSSFDADKNTYKDLPNQITSLAWMPDGTHIIYTWLNSTTGKTTLNVSNADGTGYSKVADIFNNDVEIALSPDGRSLLFYRINNSGGVNKIVLATADGKLFKTVVADGYNSGVLWAPDSQRFLFGRRDSQSQQLQLWIGDSQTGQVQNLGLATTVDKAMWSRDGQTLFVAVPKTGVAERGLTEDTINKISVNTGDKTEFDPGSGVDARNLFLNLNGDILFFQNMQNGLLYYLKVNK